MRQNILPSGTIDGVLEIAKDAAKWVLELYEKAAWVDEGVSESAFVTQKTGNSPLTQADLLPHRIIVAGLKRITLGIPIVSEEDADSLVHRKPKGFFADRPS